MQGSVRVNISAFLMLWLVLAGMGKARADMAYLPSGRVLPYVSLDGAFNDGRWVIKDSAGGRYSMNANGTTAGVSFGLGGVIGPVFWLAGELGGEFNSAHTSTVQINTPFGISDSKYRVKYGYSFSLLPGIHFGALSRLLFYGRIGVIRSKFQVSQSLYAPGDNGVHRPWETGKIFGGGVQVMVWRDWSARAEYNRVLYNSFSTDFGSRVSAHENRFRLGLMYSFI